MYIVKLAAQEQEKEGALICHAPLNHIWFVW